LSHPGPTATTRLLKKDYVWPNMSRDIKNWTGNCLDCQRAKVGRHTKTPIGEIPTTARFHTVHVEFVGPLPPCTRFRYLFTTLHRSTRWPEVIPVSDMTTESAVQALMHGWIGRYGILQVLISDRGAQFESQLWSLLMDRLNITRNRTTAYHPASNGAIERFHRSLKSSLRASCKTPDWVSALPLVLLGIRTSLNNEGFSPAQALY
ncbi:MAG: transposase family protein, partial [Gammaproteobacteria bacterium]|nr:transposase family protein [Gammaproteobacteria bacterium]